MREQSNVTRRQLKGVMPDEADRKNIVELIKLYDSIFPYPHPESLQAAIEEGIAQTTKNIGSLMTTKATDAPTKVMHLPEAFINKLKKGYPDIISDKGKFEWFLKNFPAFNLRNY